MSGPQYAYPAQPYPAQGYYQGPPVMAPPQYAAAPPKKKSGFLKGCLEALRCICCCSLEALRCICCCCSLISGNCGPTGMFAC